MPRVTQRSCRRDFDGCWVTRGSMRCRQIGGTGRANPTYASLRRETLGFGGCAAQSGQPCTFSRGGTMCRGGLGSTALSHPAARSSHTLRLVSRDEGRDASASLRFDPRNKCEGGQAHHWEGVCHWVERVGWGSPAKPVEAEREHRSRRRG